MNFLLVANGVIFIIIWIFLIYKKKLILSIKRIENNLNIYILLSTTFIFSGKINNSFIIYLSFFINILLIYDIELYLSSLTPKFLNKDKLLRYDNEFLLINYNKQQLFNECNTKHKCNLKSLKLNKILVQSNLNDDEFDNLIVNFKKNMKPNLRNSLYSTTYLIYGFSLILYAIFY